MENFKIILLSIVSLILLTSCSSNKSIVSKVKKRKYIKTNDLTPVSKQMTVKYTNNNTSTMDKQLNDTYAQHIKNSLDNSNSNNYNYIGSIYNQVQGTIYNCNEKSNGLNPFRSNKKNEYSVSIEQLNQEILINSITKKFSTCDLDINQK